MLVIFWNIYILIILNRFKGMEIYLKYEIRHMDLNKTILTL